MSFASPHLLWLLVVVPPGLVVFFWWSWRKREALVAKFIQTRLLSGLVSGMSPARRKVRLGCLVVAVASVIVALARPLGGLTYEQVKQRGLDIVVAIDTSKSMLAADISPSRLARAKLAALDIMKKARTDRLALVAFAGTAFAECPLTIDDGAFKESVEALSVKTIPQGGTAIAAAIETAQKVFKEDEAHKVIVLMSDGEDHDSGAVEAAKKAAEAGVRIYTIGVGTEQGEMMPIRDEQGRVDFVRDEQKNVVKSHLDEKCLREVADATGGFYLQLAGANTIDTLFGHPQGLANLPKSERQERLVAQYQERFQWPLGLAIALLLFEMLFPERKREAKSSASTVTGQETPPRVSAQQQVAAERS